MKYASHVYEDSILTQPKGTTIKAFVESDSFILPMIFWGLISKPYIYPEIDKLYEECPMMHRVAGSVMIRDEIAKKTGLFNNAFYKLAPYIQKQYYEKCIGIVLFDLEKNEFYTNDWMRDTSNYKKLSIVRLYLKAYNKVSNIVKTSPIVKFSEHPYLLPEEVMMSAPEVYISAFVVISRLLKKEIDYFDPQIGLMVQTLAMQFNEDLYGVSPKKLLEDKECNKLLGKEFKEVQKQIPNVLGKKGVGELSEKEKILLMLSGDTSLIKGLESRQLEKFYTLNEDEYKLLIGAYLSCTDMLKEDINPYLLYMSMGKELLQVAAAYLELGEMIESVKAESDYRGECLQKEVRELRTKKEEWERTAAKLNLLSRENATLVKQTKYLETQNQKLCTELENTKLNMDELVGLRNYMFTLNLDETVEEEVEQKEMVSIDAPGILFGGHPQFIKKLKKFLPNFRFISSEQSNFDVEILENSLSIFFVPGYLNHGIYYKVMNNIKRNTRKIVYLKSVSNIELAIQQIASELGELL